MSGSWDDEYLTVQEVADHLKLNQQTLRNWIDRGELPAVRVGRRVRIRRTDLERILARSATSIDEPQPAAVARDDPRDRLLHALVRSRGLLARQTMPRRPELASALQELSDAVMAALNLGSNSGSTSANHHRLTDEREGP
jgi:excisionase family DNA binding protein